MRFHGRSLPTVAANPPIYSSVNTITVACAGTTALLCAAFIPDQAALQCSYLNEVLAQNLSLI